MRRSAGAAPTAAGTDRMVVTVAATARTLVQPLIDALTGAGAESVSVSTATPSAAPIRVFDQSARGVLDVSKVRRALVGVVLARRPARGRLAQRRRGLRLQARRRAGRAVAPHRRAPRRDARRPRGRQAGREPAARARAAQVPDGGERHRARRAVADPARPHLRDRAAHRRRQAARDRRDARRAGADPPDRAVAALHPRHLLRADDAGAVRSGRALSHRGADRTCFRVALMSTVPRLTPADAAPVAGGARLCGGRRACCSLLAWSAVADILDRRQRDRGILRSAGATGRAPRRGGPAPAPRRRVRCRPARRSSKDRR